jgi:16S rRNA (guanine527-N7)-methyltransferase
MTADAHLSSDWHQYLGWQPDPQAQQQFEGLYRGILAGNQRLNLTRITDSQEFGEKHLWDALRPLQPWLGQTGEGLRFIDIGTGGGVPGLPAAIALPQASVLLLDATRKKIAFLEQLAQELGLSKVTGLADRAESAAHCPDLRDQFDLALIRAVGPAAVCAEYALPFVKPGGRAILYRGQWSEGEAQMLQKALRLLGGVVDEIVSFQLPRSGAQRHALYLRKQRVTPWIYPRSVGTPSQYPLGSSSIAEH